MKNQAARYLEEYERIVAAADDRGIPLRLMGAISVILHCPDHSKLHQDLSREVTDLDFMSYSKHNPEMPDFFQGLGYEPELRHMAYYGKDRHIYNHAGKGIVVDVFFDKLQMSHTIDFRGRLELDYPTIPLANIVLTKAQILRINEKDLKDLCVLFREHELGHGDRERIDGEYIAEILSKDWGFHRTFTENFRKMQEIMDGYEALSNDDRDIIRGRVQRLMEVIEEEPKSFKWKMRARVGNRVKWYNDIEERIR